MRKEAIVGISIVVAIVLLYFGINFLKGSNIFGSSNEYYAIYERVDGLVPANAVVLNGKNVGIVKSIEFLPDNSGKMLVTFEIHETKFTFYNDTRAALTSDFLGTKSIALIPGTSGVPIQPGDTLNSSIEMTINEQVSEQLLPLKTKVDGLLGQVDTLINTFQTIFDENATSSINNSFTSIEKSLRTFEKTSKRIDSLMARESGKISSITANINSITSNLKDRNAEVSALIKNMKTITDSLATADFANTVYQANLALESIAEIMEKINESEGSLGLLVNDKDMYNNLEKATKDLDLLLQDMRYNPARYVHFSIFGRKDKHKPPIEE